MTQMKQWRHTRWWAGCALVLVTCLVMACGEETGNGDTEVVDYIDGRPNPPASATFTGHPWRDSANSDCRQYQGLGSGSEAVRYVLEWGHGGDHLLFDDGETQFNATKLLVVDREGTKVRTVAVAIEDYRFKHGLYASVSPANGDILYSSCEYPFKSLAESQRIHWVFQQERGTLVEPRSLYHYELVAVGFDGANKRRLTHTGDWELKPVWSPDGKRFAYEHEREGLLLIARAGSGAHTVLRGAVHVDWLAAGGGGLRWSPDGTKVLFASGKQLRIVDLETDARVSVDAPEGGFVGEGSFSPDGSHIAWVEMGESGHVVYVGPVDGSSQRKVAEFPSAEFSRGDLGELHWSPVGPLIAFRYAHDVGDEGRGQGLYVVNQNGTGLRKIWGSSGGGIDPIRWSPDGSRIAIGGRGVVATMAPDGTDLRVLAKREPRSRQVFLPGPGVFVDVVARVSVAANPRVPHPPVYLEDCSNPRSGGAVPDPEAEPGLVADCEVLLAVRDTLAGGVFLDWRGDLPIREWEGVTVAGQPARVTEVVLRGLGLRGSTPASFGKLTHLERLDLWHNELTGAIPPQLGALANLEHLDLSYNLLEGAIPPELGRLANLEHLDLSHNMLSGAIPGELGGIVDLRVLKLQDNALTGALPGDFRHLRNMDELRLSRNRDLEGCVPDNLRAVEAVGTLLQRCWPDEDE